MWLAGELNRRSSLVSRSVRCSDCQSAIIIHGSIRLGFHGWTRAAICSLGFSSVRTRTSSGRTGRRKSPARSRRRIPSDMTPTAARILSSLPRETRTPEAVARFRGDDDGRRFRLSPSMPLPCMFVPPGAGRQAHGSAAHSVSWQASAAATRTTVPYEFEDGRSFEIHALKAATARGAGVCPQPGRAINPWQRQARVGGNEMTVPLFLFGSWHAAVQSCVPASESERAARREENSARNGQPPATAN